MLIMLGDKLRENIKAMSEKEAAKKLAEQYRIERERQETRLKRIKTIELTKETIVKTIDAGRVPKVKLADTNIREWIQACMIPGMWTVDDAIWQNFISWATNEGLKVIVDTEHSAYGEKSWTVIKVEPLE